MLLHTTSSRLPCFLNPREHYRACSSDSVKIKLGIKNISFNLTVQETNIKKYFQVNYIPRHRFDERARIMRLKRSCDI
jgi:hypothetical protein